MDDELERIRREAKEAEMQAKWDELGRKIAELGETRPDLIIWDNISYERVDKLIDNALKHECYRYVKLLQDHKEKLRRERIRQFIRGERDDI